MKRLCIFIILLGSLLSSSMVSGQGYQTMQTTIETESGRRTIEVRYHPGSDEWAKDIFRTIREGFPLLEEKIGVPCPISWDIIIEENNSLKPGVGGVNKGRLGIEVPTNTVPSVIIHELCHFWFGWEPGSDLAGWILEGFPEAYTIAVLQELGNTDGIRHWYGRLDDYEWAKAIIGDKPLTEVGYAPDFTDPRVSMLYSKATVFCTWFMLHMDEEEIQAINEEIIFIGRLSTEKYKDIAEEVAGENLDDLFSGWVYPGPYYYEGKEVSFEWFAGDGDHDGIPTLEEIETDSNPFVSDTDGDAIPDGYEPLVRCDPYNADTDSDGLLDGEEIPIIMDGKNTEWETPLVSDARDSESDAPQDVKALYYAADRSFLYFAIEFYEDISYGFHSGISIDVTDDGYADYIFFYVYDYLLLSTWENGEWVKTFYDPSQLRHTYVVADDIMEFRIPKKLKAVTFPESINVWCYEFSLLEGSITDSCNAKTISTNATVQGTDPLRSDTDGDGILDSQDARPLIADEQPASPEPEETPQPESEPEHESEGESSPAEGESESTSDPTEEHYIALDMEESDESGGSMLLLLGAGIGFCIILICVGYIISRRTSHGKKSVESDADTTICTACGHENEQGSTFCEHCGEKL